MADFFSRLAERTLGVVAVAKPVIAPLFAPGPQLVAESVALAPQASEAASRRHPVPTPAAVVQPLKPPFGTTPRQPVRHRVAELKPPTGTTPRRPEASEPSVPPIAEPSQPLGPAATPERRIPAVPVPPRKVESEVPYAEARREPNPRSPLAPAPYVQPTVAAQFRELPAPVAPHPEEPIDAQPALAVRRHVALPEMAPLIDRRPPDAPRSTVREDRTPAAPTVRISIGRIEVRAVYPEPPPQPLAGPEPRSALSLADYLKQRDGGMR